MVQKAAVYSVESMDWGLPVECVFFEMR